jgi:hypothetical protein
MVMAGFLSELFRGTGNQTFGTIGQLHRRQTMLYTHVGKNENERIDQYA